MYEPTLFAVVVHQRHEEVLHTAGLDVAEHRYGSAVADPEGDVIRVIHDHPPGHDETTKRSGPGGRSTVGHRVRVGYTFWLGYHA